MMDILCQSLDHISFIISNNVYGNHCASVKPMTRRQNVHTDYPLVR